MPRTGRTRSCRHCRSGSDGVRAGIVGQFDPITMEPNGVALNAAATACERIKSTPTPRQYDFFTRVAVIVFATLLPFGLESVVPADQWWWLMVLSIALSGVFIVLERVGAVVDTPFENQVTGFWWSELSHPYYRFTELGYHVEIFSPDGGACVADAMSDPEDASQWQAEDVISRGDKHDPTFMPLIENTHSVDEIDLDSCDAIVVTGGQGPIFTMENATNLHQKFVEFFEAGKIAAELCMGSADVIVRALGE